MITFKHELTLTENLHTLCDKQVDVQLMPGQRVFLNAGIVMHTHKAWKYKHRWEFLYSNLADEDESAAE